MEDFRVKLVSMASSRLPWPWSERMAIHYLPMRDLAMRHFGVTYHRVPYGEGKPADLLGICSNAFLS
jgi:hypothetical protein